MTAPDLYVQDVTLRDGMHAVRHRIEPTDVARIVAALEGAGYTGWYVLEQDTILTGAPTGEGPVADVRASVEYMRGLNVWDRT